MVPISLYAVGSTPCCSGGQSDPSPLHGPTVGSEAVLQHPRQVFHPQTKLTISSCSPHTYPSPGGGGQGASKHLLIVTWCLDTNLLWLTPVYTIQLPTASNSVRWKPAVVLQDLPKTLIYSSSFYYRYYKMWLKEQNNKFALLGFFFYSQNIENLVLNKGIIWLPTSHYCRCCKHGTPETETRVLFRFKGGFGTCLLTSSSAGGT